MLHRHPQRSEESGNFTQTPNTTTGLSTSAAGRAQPY